MIDKEKKLRFLRRVLGEETLRKGNEVVFVCPRSECRHDKSKLSVNLATDWFHCWICDYKGRNLVPLLRLKGDTQDLQEYLSSIKSVTDAVLSPAKLYDEPLLPKEFRSLSSPSASPYYRNAMEYLAARGVSIDDIVRWKLGYCEEGEYKYRIMIPSFDENGDLNFFVGRSYYGHALKYMHGNFNKDIIFNDYLIDWKRPIVVTEGPFDAIKARDNVVALQGSILNEGSQLFRKIVTTGVDVYFAMDSDAFEKQLEIIRLFFSYGVNSYYVNLGGKKDVGEMMYAEFQLAKSKAQTITSSFDLLKMRLLA